MIPGFRPIKPMVLAGEEGLVQHSLAQKPALDCTDSAARL
jgi:hypothetical protein